MFDFWKLLAGIAIFVLGMNYLEGALRMLSGRKFKLFLRKQTAKPASAIASGALATVVLQSSSVVNMLVLALVGAGTIPMRNALAVVLGSNVGTTLTTWVIAVVGFELNIEVIAFPSIAVADIGLMLTQEKTALHNWLSFFLGIGFLFFGLDMMQDGIEDGVRTFDFSLLANYPTIAFVGAGIVITSLIQSSSATMALTLTALNANIVTLPAAMAIALGSEIGTTFKLVIASAGRTPATRRVALGNFLFNFITAIIAFIFLHQARVLIVDIVKVPTELVALSFFQTLVNVVSIILFYPLLGLFQKFLDNRFRDGEHESTYISKVPVSEPELALNAIKSEARLMLKNVIHFGAELFHSHKPELLTLNIPESFRERTLHGKYDFIKHLHGDIYNYCLPLRNSLSHQDQNLQLDRLITAVRRAMYASKSFKDAEQDIEQLRDSANEVKYRFYTTAQEKATQLFGRIADLLQTDNGEESFEHLVQLYQLIQNSYTSTLHDFYRSQETSSLSEIEISTIINFNREMYSGFRSLLLAAKDILLNDEGAKYFDDLPGFVR